MSIVGRAVEGIDNPSEFRAASARISTFLRQNIVTRVMFSDGIYDNFFRSFVDFRNQVLCFTLLVFDDANFTQMLFKKCASEPGCFDCNC